MSLSRTCRAAVILGVGVLSACTAAASAGAQVAATPSGSGFVPPTVGPVTVDIGPTIIGGKVIDPGLHVTLPPATPDGGAATFQPPAQENSGVERSPAGRWVQPGGVL